MQKGLFMIVAVALIFTCIAAATVAPSFGQMDDQMEMGDNTTATTNASSPMTYNLTDSNVQVKLSWQPESINTDEPTKFTYEFLNVSTGEHLSDVSYAVHMALDGESVGHGHNGTAPEGIGTFEQQFDSQGSLSIVLESIKVGNSAIDGVAQFSINVVPEFPLAPVMIAGVVLGGIVAASRIFKTRL